MGDVAIGEVAGSGVVGWLDGLDPLENGGVVCGEMCWGVHRMILASTRSWNMRMLVSLRVFAALTWKQKSS